MALTFPSCPCRLQSRCAAFLCAHGFQAALAADSAALLPHFGHDATYEGEIVFWSIVGFGDNVHRSIGHYIGIG